MARKITRANVVQLPKDTRGLVKSRLQSLNALTVASG
jgi:hypothetical protein